MTLTIRTRQTEEWLALMNFIRHFPGENVTHIALKVHRLYPSVSRQLGHLHARGLVTQRNHPALTPKGADELFKANEERIEMLLAFNAKAYNWKNWSNGVFE